MKSIGYAVVKAADPGRARARGWALVLALSAGFAGRVHAQLAVDPLEIFIRPSAARFSKVATITIRNPSDVATQALIHLEDWDRGLDGDNRFYPLGSRPGSCGKRVRVSPASVRLEAKATQIVRVTSDEDSLPSECWTIVMVEGADSKPAKAQFAITYTFRTGVKVYVTPEGVKPEGRVENVEVLADRAFAGPGTPAAHDTVARPARIAFTFSNTGGMHLNAKGQILIRRPADNSTAAKIDVTEFPVLPGARRRYTADMPVLKPGAYVLIVVLDYKGSERAAGQIEYEVK
jgi:P pilus assembly chaperone PapD